MTTTPHLYAPAPFEPTTPAEAAAIHHTMRQRLPAWTITERPLDYPDGYIARLFLALPEPTVTDVALTAATLDDLRELLPPGLCPIPRDPSDDHVIVESWL